ncbi:hypothetical protein AB1Y20_006123 [Prymnesium parvum]|uniref:Uncharacterized protein n=1 Tax=Prymnesium parvum TaxID=97485 RepID=A0AB34J0W5_PRYPA
MPPPAERRLLSRDDDGAPTAVESFRHARRMNEQALSELRHPPLPATRGDPFDDCAAPEADESVWAAHGVELASSSGELRVARLEAALETASARSAHASSALREEMRARREAEAAAARVAAEGLRERQLMVGALALAASAMREARDTLELGHAADGGEAVREAVEALCSRGETLSATAAAVGRAIDAPWSRTDESRGGLAERLASALGDATEGWKECVASLGGLRWVTERRESASQLQSRLVAMQALTHRRSICSSSAAPSLRPPPHMQARLEQVEFWYAELQAWCEALDVPETTPTRPVRSGAEGKASTHAARHVASPDSEAKRNRALVRELRLELEAERQREAEGFSKRLELKDQVAQLRAEVKRQAAAAAAARDAQNGASEALRVARAKVEQLQAELDQRQRNERQLQTAASEARKQQSRLQRRAQARRHELRAAHRELELQVFALRTPRARQSYDTPVTAARASEGGTASPPYSPPPILSLAHQSLHPGSRNEKSPAAAAGRAIAIQAIRSNGEAMLRVLSLTCARELAVCDERLATLEKRWSADRAAASAEIKALLAEARLYREGVERAASDEMIKLERHAAQAEKARLLRRTDELSSLVDLLTRKLNQEGEVRTMAILSNQLQGMRPQGAAGGGGPERNASEHKAAGPRVRGEPRWESPSSQLLAQAMEAEAEAQVELLTKAMLAESELAVAAAVHAAKTEGEAAVAAARLEGKKAERAAVREARERAEEAASKAVREAKAEAAAATQAAVAAARKEAEAMAAEAVAKAKAEGAAALAAAVESARAEAKAASIAAIDVAVKEGEAALAAAVRDARAEGEAATAVAVGVARAQAEAAVQAAMAAARQEGEAAAAAAAEAVRVECDAKLAKAVEEVRQEGVKAMVAAVSAARKDAENAVADAIAASKEQAAAELEEAVAWAREEGQREVAAAVEAARAEGDEEIATAVAAVRAECEAAAFAAVGATRLQDAETSKAALRRAREEGDAAMRAAVEAAKAEQEAEVVAAVEQMAAGSPPRGSTPRSTSLSPGEGHASPLRVAPLSASSARSPPSAGSLAARVAAAVEAVKSEAAAEQAAAMAAVMQERDAMVNALSRELKGNEAHVAAAVEAARAAAEAATAIALESARAASESALEAAKAEGAAAVKATREAMQAEASAALAAMERALRLEGEAAMQAGPTPPLAASSHTRRSPAAPHLRLSVSAA